MSEFGPGAPGDRPEDYELSEAEKQRILAETDPQVVADKLEAERYAKVLRKSRSAWTLLPDSSNHHSSP